MNCVEKKIAEFEVHCAEGGEIPDEMAWQLVFLAGLAAGNWLCMDVGEAEVWFACGEAAAVWEKQLKASDGVEEGQAPGAEAAP